MLKFAIIAVVIFGVGAAFGSTVPPTPDPEFVEVPQTKVIYRDAEPPPTPEAVLPESCVTAMKQAAKLANEASELYASGPIQLRIISAARIAIYDQSYPELARVQDAQNDLRGQTVGNLDELEEALGTYHLAIAKCKEEEND